MNGLGGPAIAHWLLVALACACSGEPGGSSPRAAGGVPSQADFGTRIVPPGGTGGASGQVNPGAIADVPSQVDPGTELVLSAPPRLDALSTKWTKWQRRQMSCVRATLSPSQASWVTTLSQLNGSSREAVEPGGGVGLGVARRLRKRRGAFDYRHARDRSVPFDDQREHDGSGTLRAFGIGDVGARLDDGWRELGCGLCASVRARQQYRKANARSAK